MPQLSAFFHPRSLPEALALLREHGDRARPLAGGTSLVFSRSSRLEALVDLGRVGLDTIQERDGALHVGAMVSCTALRRHLEGQPPGALLEAAGLPGSRILQNQITVGGNCVMVYAWSDLPVVMWCLGARFEIAGEQPRILDADAFFGGPPARVLGPADLLVAVQVPRAPAGSGSVYFKFRRTEMDHALASVAAQVNLEAGRVASARIVAGAVRGGPQVLAGAAGALEGQAPEQGLLQEVARQAAQEARVAADFRATADYRKQLLAVLVEDALSEAVRRAGGAR
jgi:carbon-monoxide dehydrogenase medium subunit